MNSSNNPQSIRRTLSGLAMLLALSPALAHANSFRGVGSLVFVMFVGIPYALVLVIFGILVLVKMSKGQYSDKTRGFGYNLFVGSLISAVLFTGVSMFAGADLNLIVGLQLALPNIFVACIVGLLGFALSKMMDEDEDEEFSRSTNTPDP